MKKLVTVLFAASFFLVAAPAYAQMGMMGNWQNPGTGTATQTLSSNANIGAALQDIYKTQNVSDQTKVDCSKVTDDQFEKLGDAYMGAGITEAQHTAMENMMGGEGSSTLKSAHITMGRSYLGCWANYNGAPSVIPMMANPSLNQGFSMMGNGYGSGLGMMNGWKTVPGRYSAVAMWFGFVTLVLVWGFLVLSIMALWRWLAKNK